MKSGMMKTAVFIFFLMCCVFSSLSSQAEPLNIGVGISKPPYIIQESNSGVEYELVSRALQIAGYEMIPKYMPLRRIPHNLNAGALDGGVHLRAHLEIDGFFSSEVISYQNYAISVAGSGLDIRSMQDLKNYSVIAFQNAHKLLGESFAEAVEDNEKYSEIANQELQVRMLKAGRAQVVVADFRIFRHFAKLVEEQDGDKKRFVFHRIFKPTPYRAAFRERMIRDRFDIALAEMRRSGEYDRIIAKYMSYSDGVALSH